MKKILILICSLFLLATVQATLPISNLPSTISLNCGESYYDSFSITGENITVIPGTVGSSIGYRFSPSYHPTSKIVFISFFQTSTCSAGTSTFTFWVNDVLKSIELEVSEDLWSLGTISVSKGKRIDIGNIAHLGVLEISDTQVQYLLSGCGTTEQGLLEEGDTLEAICSEEAVEIKLKNSYGSPFNFAEFEIFSSEAGLILTSSNETVIEDPSECELGLDTLGAKVKRGNIFAIKSINVNSGKFVDSVAVTILDQQGELSPISGLSSNIGFFSERLHADYLQDLIVQLEKEGCEPSTQVILFEQSYDDYKLAKESEQGALQLVLNVSGRFVMSTAISWTVTNALGEVVEGVDVKITKPDSVSLIVTTDSGGVFSFTPDILGLWKIQGGKDNYESTRLNEIEIYQDRTYLIVIKVNGEQKAEYKKNDRISFELRDANNTLLPLTIDSTFAGLPLRFVSGISDTATFTGTSTLTIPAVEGYIEQTITLTEKTVNASNVLWGIGIAIGVIVILFLIGAVVKKKRGSGKPPQQMEFQVGSPGDK